ncbi:MAG: DUF4965 domain-containing protein [Bacteroidaceae bacterium]|nr:DUF4965 domain-containing protein [Bacteroidaceae bacterium]
MKNRSFLLLIAATFMSLHLSAQSDDFFTPYRTTDLRLPSVPLVVNDPYFSLWSPFDKLTDGNTRHWTHAEKAMGGLLRVDGTTYRWMGKETEALLTAIAPMTNVEAWTARVSYSLSTGWMNPSFNDSSWKTETAAWGTANEYPHVKTSWTATNSDIYIRRPVTLSADDLKEDLWIVFSHDDVFEMYLNGTRIISTGETWLQGERLQLSAVQRALLHEGENIIAAHCHNTTGGAYVDFGLYKNTLVKNADIKIATQKSVDVLATSTYYTFSCGPVELDAVFTAPMIIDNLDLLSTPVNYISTRVRSTDGQPHDVCLLFETTPQLTVNDEMQPTTSTLIEENGIRYLKAGTQAQPVLGRSGDLICIDWGYLYLPAVNGEVSLASQLIIEETFAETGNLPESETSINSTCLEDLPALAWRHDFGSVTEGSTFMMLGYDEVYDIQYMKQNYKGYWARNGKTIFQAFEELRDGYNDIMARCHQQDKTIYDDGLQAANVHYAELLSASYRQVIAAHKLFEDKDGNLLFFSKENNSNGCVNTVDLTYPSAPLFLCYNPDLEKAMITSIYDYTRSGKWNKDFAAHDLGTYPHANGQVYGGDMPLEESGNILILTAYIVEREGFSTWMRKYWNIAKRWTDYLVANGQDPANQLCTDDFAGHWAHNANLSIKAIMGVAAFAKIARVRGLETNSPTYLNMADEYMAKAAAMARQWEMDARDGDHYRLAFDRENTWSLKYNMVWDKLWQTNLFPNRAMQREIRFYRNKQNRYGIPLDNRETYTKSDWVLWMAAMADDNDTFIRFMEPMYKYVNETPSRVPICDWHWTTSGEMRGFRARSVIGGYWMKVLMDKHVSPESNNSWHPADTTVLTKWGLQLDTANVLPEYPRPLLQRSEWQSMNGLWDCAVTKVASTPSSFSEKILVPFPLESSLSGIGTWLDDGYYLWYRKEFTIPEEWSGKNILLHLGAIDNISYLWLNGSVIKRNNIGGYTELTIDITKNLTTDGTPNVLLIRVTDPTDEEAQVIGLQRSKPEGNDEQGFSSVSGIWQTVWMEPVESTYISNLRISPDVDKSTLTVNVTTEGATGGQVKVVLKDGSSVITETAGNADEAIILPVTNAHLWSPADPFLYDLDVTLSVDGVTTDAVSSYAAMRKIATVQDTEGRWHFQLNNQDLFLYGVLDEGYWPDGVYTAPSDEALAYDIELARSLGFNTIRKHQKVEPQRWYYHCDRLGMLVWQDMPAIAKETEIWEPYAWYSDDDGSLSTSAASRYKSEWRSIVTALYNHPSIVIWTLFDEAKGQHKTAETVALTREMDSTRLIDAASGGNHHKGEGNMLDLHNTGKNLAITFCDASLPFVLGKCGGNTSNNIDQYTALVATLQTLAKGTVVSRINTALAAAVYARLTDVELQADGLVTADRSTIKMDAETIAAASDALCRVYGDGLSSIEAPEVTSRSTFYDVMGRPIDIVPSGTIVIAHDAEGKVSKIFIK